MIPGFDPYLHSLIALDHLLTGLFLDVMNFSILVLVKPDLRQEFETQRLTMLRSAQLGHQNKLF